MAGKRTKKSVKTNKQTALIVLLVVWLLAWPLAVGLTVTANLTTSTDDVIVNEFAPEGSLTIDDTTEQSVTNQSIRVLALIFGAYALLGWIPMVVVAAQDKKK